MGRNRFVSGDIERLPISDGDWIEIKKDLNNGDSLKVENAGRGTPVRLPDGLIYTPIDWSMHDIERAAVFLTDWSLHGTDDKPVALKDQNGVVQIEQLKAIDPATFKEINDAILAYVVKRMKEKNAQRTPPAAVPSTTQPSA